MSKDKQSFGKLDEHIDNGGITIEVVDNDGSMQLITSTSYYGYPSIDTTMHLEYFGRGTPAFLRKLGAMLLEAAKEIETKVDLDARFNPL